MIETNEPTLDEYLDDFTERCREVENLSLIRENVLSGNCPFFEEGFEKNTQFKRMRRYYRKHMDYLRDSLLKIIKEVER